MTNYERIKNMSIEEMAVTLMCPIDMGMMDGTCADRDLQTNIKNCCSCVFEWLREDDGK